MGNSNKTTVSTRLSQFDYNWASDCFPFYTICIPQDMLLSRNVVNGIRMGPIELKYISSPF